MAAPSLDSSPTHPHRWMFAALVLALTVSAAFPAALLDGDSCMNASLSRDMARGDLDTVLAPRWAQGGKWTWYHEHALGSYQLASLCIRAGLPADRAPHVAHTLWMVLAAWGVLTLVGTQRRDAAMWIGAVALLLHLQPLKYVQRISIEFPLAATTVWSLVAVLRLREGWRWVFVGTLALAGAFLVRGIFGAVALALVTGAVLFRETRPPWPRLLGMLLLSGGLVFAFDRAHASVTGGGWWWWYFHRQIASSFVEGGTQHTVADRQFLYFAVRLVGYAMPFLLLVIWRLARGPRWQPGRAIWCLLLGGIALTWLGASITRRPASRYLFSAWPLLATLFALSLPPTLPARIKRAMPVLVLLLVPTLLIGKHVTRKDDDWARAARALATLRHAEDAPAVVRGPFDPQDSRDKAFLRWHLDTRAIGGTPAGPEWWIVRTEAEVPEAAVVRARLPFGVLLSPRTD